MLKGWATPAGTAQYRAKHPTISFSCPGDTGLMFSGAGFGCYRVDISISEHQAALRQALLSGINVIDTSANYADGGSERLVGYVVSQLSTAGKVQRDGVIIVSKAGYLQGANYKISQERKKQGQRFPELVVYDEGLEHCIHPEFLDHQITASLERLGMERIDCFLLHNPEYYLKWAYREGVDKEEARQEYLRRIHSAFVHLEDEVRQGRISWYGISSNTFPSHQEDFDFTPLDQITELAQTISLHHHFRVIELPLNLMEPEAMTEKNQRDGKTVIDLAREHRLAVLINRPLNAISQDRLVRLDETVYQGKAASEAAQFRDAVAELKPSWKKVSHLRHLALLALCSTYGITSVLVGMRREEYVKDVLQVLSEPYEQGDNLEIWNKIGSHYGNS